MLKSDAWGGRVYMCCCLCDLEVRSVSFLNVHGISRDIYHILEESVPPFLFCFMPDIFIACTYQPFLVP